MRIRIRAILIIVLVNLAIILFSIFAGIVNVSNNIDESQETDLLLISDFADHYISSEIMAVKLKAAGIAQSISGYDDTKWPGVLADIRYEYPEFLGFTIIDPQTGLFAEAGELPPPADLADDKLVRQAFFGRSVISSTVPIPDHGVVFYLAVQIPKTANRMLAITLPGTYFSDRISTFAVWETGHLIIDDAEGNIIATTNTEWVEDRVNFIHMAEIDSSYEEIAVLLNQAALGEKGISRFSFFGIPRLCAYRPIAGSDEGWSLGVVVPLSESPFRNIDKTLVVVGLVSLFLSVIAAVIASVFIKKPFEEIAALKEAAEANSKYKSGFIAGMSHEIRTPMNAIMGVTEIMLQDESIDKGITDGLNKIYNSGDLLLSIINDILDLSKIEAGKMELFTDKYELASMINDTVMLSIIRIESKPVEFKLQVDKNLPAELIGDELRIKQILNNLLSNACKYTDAGEIRLSFSVDGDAGESGAPLTLVFCVSDTGQGMTEEQVAAMFDEYSRFNFEANRTTEGTGLGMSITQKLLDLMNGEILVESEPNKGSVFTVRIPQERVGPKVIGRELAGQLQDFRMDAVRQAKKSQLIHEPMPYGRILIVDDVESNLFVIKGLLAFYKLSVDSATSGPQAIDMLANGNVYDIVFMDHMMPKMDGIEATKIIRGRGYTHPIIALTANAVAGQMDIFLENGFDDFISKPIDMRYLNTVLKKYVRDKQPPEVIEAANRQAGSVALAADDRKTSSVSPRLAEFFVQDAGKALEALEILSEKLDSFEREDFLLYATHVHAMKSAFANVGEKKPSIAAARLEQAAKDMEIDVLQDETPEFLDILRATITKFTPLEDDDACGDLSDDDIGYLRETLLSIIVACELYDKKTAKDAIAVLRQKAWPQKVRELLGDMSANLLSGDFDVVLSTAGSIMNLYKV